MIVHTVSEFTHHFVSLTDGNHALFLLTGKSLINGTIVLAQTYDILDNVQKAWNDFWSSGQGAAFVVGVMFGWFIKSIRP